MVRAVLALAAMGCAEPTRWRPQLEALDVPSVGVYGVQWVRVEAPYGVPVTLDVDDGRTAWTVRSERVSEVHELPLLGLGGDRSITVVAHAPDARPSAPLTFTTPPFPAAAPRVEVLAHVPEAVEPGFLLFGLRANDEGVPSAIVVLDPALEPVLWIEADPPVGDLRVGPEGTLLGLVAGDLIERDLCGRVRRHIGPSEFAAVPLAVPDGLHHELVPLPDNRFVSLSSDTRSVPEYPRSYADPTPGGPADLRDQLVVWFDDRGQVSQLQSMADLLDPTRLGYNGLDSTELGLDWAHANGFAVDPRDGGVVVSLRHQDALVKLNPDGSLRWILGDPAGWRPPWADRLLRPVGTPSWAYHQHAPELHPDGTLLVFDNHNNGATPYTDRPDAPPTSRVVAWHVDDLAGTVEHLWSLEQTATGPIYAAVVGDADLQVVTGNVLRNYGILRDDPDGPSYARVVEQHPDRPDEVLLDLRLSLPGDLAPSGVNLWRVEKIPSLYPVDPADVCAPGPASCCPAASPRRGPSPRR
ncbi:MAG: arylsulfate sulfotransferase [Myxococcota bacterium]|jgi:arylsulfate sulfotransferase